MPSGERSASEILRSIGAKQRELAGLERQRARTLLGHTRSYLEDAQPLAAAISAFESLDMLGDAEIDHFKGDLATGAARVAEFIEGKPPVSRS
ncbi:MAG TPA: hypothetical protein VEW42_00770 [Candidatus Eisenbacteria bacterium]|nr:hypothetical protein [Candidatus Eisenbacteria bacterium]